MIVTHRIIDATALVLNVVQLDLGQIARTVVACPKKVLIDTFINL
jgi:hypothetical protein